jgi:hypothetical protein
MELAATGLKFVGKWKAAKEEKRAAYAQAAAMRKKAGAKRAEGQHSAEEEQRQADLIESRAVAVAAASGGGVDNPTVTRLRAEIDAEGDYRALIRRYSADYEAQQLEEGATEAEVSGRRRSTIRKIGAGATLFGDVSDMWNT